MKATIFLQTALALLLPLTGHAASLPLVMPGAEPINVSVPSSVGTLRPADPDYRLLQQWVATNQSGWSRVYATNPNGGILVSLGKVRLQFVGTTVFALTDHGMFSKPVKQAAYSFLVKASGT